MFQGGPYFEQNIKRSRMAFFEGTIRLGPASHIVGKNKQGFGLTIVYLDHERYQFPSVAYI